MPGHLTPADVRQQIESGKTEPLYLITGDDESAMSAIATALVESVDEEFRAFNVQRFHGTDAGVTLATVLDAASTFPLLAPRRLVVLHQADRALAGRRGQQDEGEEDAAGGEGGGKGQTALLRAYAQHPHAHAVVVLIGPGLGRVFDPLASTAAVVACEASADVIRALEVEHGVRFARDAADRLRQLAGADVGRLRADVERVLLYAAGQQTITREQVDAVVTRAAAGRKLWLEVASRRTASALRELELELADGAVPFMLLGLLRSVVERTVAQRDLGKAIGALLRTDLALKTSGGDPRVLLERLVVELCATGTAGR
jgi:DNA polymerase III delta subunit